MPQVAAATARPSTHAEAHDNAFRLRGVSNPIPLLTQAECQAILAHQASRNLPAPLDWWKGRAASDPFYHALACDERILGLLRPLLGRDIVLWGVDLVRREPRQAHPWHCDIESAAPDGRFASVWIGLENVSRESALISIAGSHRFGRTIQEEAARWGLKRGQASSDLVLSWARGHDRHAAPFQPEMGDGDALVFDGRIWHGTYNGRAAGTRSALLLQYAAATSPVRMIDTAHLEWPFRFRTDRLPPVIAVSGSADISVNRVVPPPLPADAGTPLDAVVKPLPLPLAKDRAVPWQPFPQFRGATRALPLMGCHVSVLDPGHSPHPPHAHGEEEILIVLDGEAEIAIAASPEDANPRWEPLARGQLSYYPAFQHHTIRNVSAAPVTYLMFKWLGGPRSASNELAASVFDPAAHASVHDRRAFAPSLIFEAATLYLKKLHCHVTRLAPGAFYEPHVDSYDVAMVLLEGAIETLGASLERSGFVYCGSGIPHGMRNPGTTPATYLVFEFHPA